MNLTAIAAVLPGPVDKRGNADVSSTTSPCPPSEQVANLPFAHGRRFCALDDYLTHLERYAAPIDQPWWKMIRPGIYRRIGTATKATGETATRAELMKRYRFKR